MQLLLLSVIAYFNFAQLANAECSDAEYGGFCTLKSNPETMEIINDQLFVGTANVLQVFRLSHLQLSVSVNLSSDSSTVNFCTGINGFGINAVDCMNFIRIIRHFPGEDEDEDSVLVCGTNAYSPECNVHQLSDPSAYRKLSAPGMTDAGFSPFSKTFPISAIWASNGRFFSATRFEEIGLQTIRMSPRAQENDTSFTLSTAQNNQWLNAPIFVSAYEHGEHVYFFMSEPALEMQQQVRYSRAVRICKTDDGIITDHEGDIFRTFQKARMVCTVQGSSGSIPFYYNDLASTFLDTDVLYGTFNSPINGPAGGAICKFSFDSSQDGSITKVFDDGNYLIQDNSATSGQNDWVKSVRTPFSCPGDGRSAADVADHHLKFDPIVPILEEPVFVSKSEFLDKIAAETVLYKGDSQEILYFTNKQGDIVQVVKSSQGSGQNYEHVIFKSESPNPVKELILHQQGSVRNLIASSSNQIKKISRGDCSSSYYSSCFGCFDSRDAYCGWNPDTQTCLNKLDDDNLPNLMQSFSASEATITETCGNRAVLPTIAPTAGPGTPCSPRPPPSSSSTSEITTNTDEAKDCTTKMDFAGSTASSEGVVGAGGGGPSIAVVVGASVGTFLLGLAIGSIICVVFFKQFSCSRSHKKGMSPEAPGEHVSLSTGNATTQVNNNEKGSIEKPEIHEANQSKLQAVLPPRYVPHALNPTKLPPLPPPPPPPATTTTTTTTTEPAKIIIPSRALNTLDNTTSLPPVYVHANGTANRHQLPEVTEEDCAFADNDTLPPLKLFPSPVNMYGSLGRNKTGSNGVSRKQIPGHKVPRGRTDSTKWLRQRSESWSSESTSPLSPISDV